MSKSFSVVENPPFAPFTFDGLYPFLVCSDRPAHNARVFDYVRDCVRVGNLLNSHFIHFWDDTVLCYRPAVAVDNRVVSRSMLGYPAVCFCIFDSVEALSVDIRDNYSQTLTDWSRVYVRLLRLVCSSDSLFRQLSKIDIDFLDDACFPWYMERFGISGGGE